MAFYTVNNTVDESDLQNTAVNSLNDKEVVLEPGSVLCGYKDIAKVEKSALAGTPMRLSHPARPPDVRI